MEGRRSFGQEAGLDAAQVQDEDRRNRPCPEMSFGPEAATGVFVRLEGRRQAQSRSSRLDGKGVEMIFGTQAGWCGGKPRSGRCLTGLSFLLEAAAGGLVRLEGQKPAALTSGPEGRGWIWPSRGRCCTHRGPLAGGTNEDAHAPTTTPSPAGRSASSSEALPFLPDRSASERALRCGVAVDGGYAAVGWWSRIGGGAAVWSRPVGCGKCRRTAQVGLPRLSPSLCLERWAGRAFCLGRWMGVCLRLHPGRWPQGEGRSAVWCGGRWRVLPLGRMKRVILQVWAGRVMPMWIRATRRQAQGCQAAGGWRPALWLGGGRMRAGWGGGSPPRAGLCAGGRAKQPLCVRWPSGTGHQAGGCGQSTFVLEAAWRGGVQPSVRM